MIAIIKRHNRLNGVLFSIVEFALIALVIGGYATYYVLHGRAALALIGWGITLNSLCVVAIGIRMRTDRNEPRTRPFWDARARREHRRENPHMLQDTLALTFATLMPFLSMLIVVVETLRLRTGTKD